MSIRYEPLNDGKRHAYTSGRGTVGVVNFEGDRKECFQIESIISGVGRLS